MGGFDISVGANMGFVSIVASLLMTEGGSVIEGAAGGLLAGTLVGCINGVLIARFKVTPFVATLGVMTFLSGLSDQLSHRGSVTYSRRRSGDWVAIFGDPFHLRWAWPLARAAFPG